ncbi:ammonium transporter [Nocardia farcinica]|uniref:ammonium transporter n=1 Tax=Nocardia farcinica TaxID=37329 RepID=UPI001893E882|nr:ammonium transporter [Nocardia farcinica]MBF6138714.1 ammonium transporter [Nocardia farcinica]
MLFRKLSAVVVPLLAAVTVGASTAQAQPAPAPVPDIGYEAKLVGDKIVTTLTGGTFQVNGATVDIRDAAGNAVVTLPLAFREAGLEYPLGHQVREDGRVLELTAVKDASQARPVPVTPVASLEENQRAMDAFAAQFGIATAIGGFIGTALGALVGLTGIIGGPTVIASVIAGASVGAIIGTLVVGGPALVVAGIDLINTLTAPPGTTKWMDETGR